MDRIERSMRMIEARIKESSNKKDDDIEYKGLLAKLKKKDEGKKEMDDIDRVANYVKQIRETKEAILNGRTKSKR
jgi:hypothetical protein